MGLLDNLDGIVLRGVTELGMDGFVGVLEPHGDELLAFLERMPALARLITGDNNEEELDFALDRLGRTDRPVVVRAER